MVAGLMEVRQVAAEGFAGTEIKEEETGGYGDPEGEARSTWRGLGFQKWKGKVYI